MKFVLLTEVLAHTVAPWFDDVDTIRYLGNRDWLYRALSLMQTAPGSEFKGRRVLARYIWIVQDENQRPYGLVDFEQYDDGTAGMALVVAPQQRGQGVGQHILRLLESQPELQSIQTIIGSVEPENIAARECLESAGYTFASTPDDEGFLRFHKQLFYPLC